MLGKKYRILKNNLYPPPLPYRAPRYGEIGVCIKVLDNLLYLKFEDENIMGSVTRTPGQYNVFERHVRMLLDPLEALIEEVQNKPYVDSD